MEAWLTRGDRRMAEVIYQAWSNGARFDAWQEHFSQSAWEQAFDACGLSPFFYTHRQRALDEIFPWDHIDTGVRKKFLQEDYQWSLEGRMRGFCREACYACGILPSFAALRRQHPGESWKCPEVKSPAHAALALDGANQS
jgi:hypothetical protein